MGRLATRTGKRMSSLIQVLVLVCLVLAYVQGELIQVKLPKPSSDPQGGCHLPDVINVGLLHHQTNRQWEMQLRRNDVISKNRMVYVMSQDENKRAVLEHVPLRGQEGLSQGYHNHEEGAAFLVTCISLTTDPVFLMEGSLYINGQKFRLSPASSWQQKAEGASDDVNFSIYDLQGITDFQAGDSAFIKAPNERVKRRSSERRERRRDQRVKRQTSFYYLDILPVVDPEMYQQWENRFNSVNEIRTKISNYLAAVYTSVNMRLDTLDLTEGRKIQVRMLDPMLIMNPSQAPYGTIDTSKSEPVLLNATALLESFKDWINLMKGESPLPEHDHAMLFTSHDLIGGIDSGINFNVTKGLAFVGKVCDRNGFSASVIGDKGAYQSEGVVAHELGHSLGADHDGYGGSTSCQSRDRFIMADSSYPQTSQNSGHPWVFSPCSSTSIDKLLEDLESDNEILSQCLESSRGEAVNRNISVRADDQCKVFYGQDSYVCRGGESPPFEEVCHEFYCYVPGTQKCERMAPATGTCCGTQKKCVSGVCVPAAEGECPLDDECPLKDVESYATSTGIGRCEDGPTGNCYSEAFRGQCCNYCKSVKSNQTGCPYGDKQAGCEAEECGSTISSGKYVNVIYDFVCCKTCDGVKQGCRDVGSFTYEGSPTTCTELLENQNKREVCYQSQAHFDACCDTCEKLRDHSNPACSWGDHTDCSPLLKLTTGKTCDSPDVKVYYSSMDLPVECCATCPLLVTRATPTNTTSTPTSPTTKSRTKSSTTKSTTKKPTNQDRTTKSPTVCEDAARCGCDSVFSTVSWTVLMSAVCVCLGQMWC